MAAVRYRAHIATTTDTDWPDPSLAGQTGQVVAAGTNTPLTISEDETGSRLIPESLLTVTSQVMIPGFWCQDGTTEADWLSGDFRVPLDSMTGLREAADAAVVAAREARDKAAENVEAAAEVAAEKAVLSATGTIGTEVQKAASEWGTADPIEISDATVAAVAGDETSATIAALNKRFARGKWFRHQDITGTLSYHESRVVLGSEHNAINAASGDAAILGGGRALTENVIGGREENVNNNDASNLPADKTVAADYSVILGGYDNVNNALASFLAGQHCLIREAAAGGHHAIYGGSVHKINAGGYHTIMGGTQNTVNATGTFGTILGGKGNTIAATGDNGTIIGGQTNTVSGAYGVVLGGTNNVASGSSASVVGGNTNTASGQGAAVVSGRVNTAAQIDSTAMGNSSNPSQRGGAAIANGSFAVAGDAQAETFVARRQSIDATTAALGIVGGAQAPVIPPDTSWLVRGMVVARNTDDAANESAAWTFTALARRGPTGNATLVGTPTITPVAADTGATTWTLGISTGASTFNINATGEAGKTIRWVARCDVAQVQG